MPVRGERGTAAIESMVAVSFLVTAIPLGLAVMYFSFARVWIDRNAYEALICLSTSASESKCRDDFRASLARVLHIGRLQSLHLQRMPLEAKIDLWFAISDRIRIHHRNSLRLPLEPENAL